MRLSVRFLVNALAWALIAALIVAAVLITNRLGFAGLFLFGMLTWLICTNASLDQNVPTWGVHVFRSAMQRPSSAERRAAAHAEQEAAQLPLRFYGWCGAFLAAIGALGFAWDISR